MQSVSIAQVSTSSFRSTQARSIAAALNISASRVKVTGVSTKPPAAVAASSAPRTDLETLAFYLTVLIVADPAAATSSSSGASLTALANTLAAMATTPDSALAQQVAAATPGVTVDASVQPTVTVSSFTCSDGTVLSVCPTAASDASSPESGLSLVTIAIMAGVSVVLVVACLWLCRHRARSMIAR
jgi:hypothetical protein